MADGSPPRGKQAGIGNAYFNGFLYAANQRWSLEFVANTRTSGWRFRVLTLVDDFSRECLGLVIDNSLSGIRADGELDRIVET